MTTPRTRAFRAVVEMPSGISAVIKYRREQSIEMPDGTVLPIGQLPDTLVSVLPDDAAFPVTDPGTGATLRMATPGELKNLLRCHSEAEEVAKLAAEAQAAAAAKAAQTGGGNA